MKINSINTYNKIINGQKIRYNKINFCSNDSFVKSENKDLKSEKTYKEFKNWAEKNNFLSEIKNITNSPKNIIGSGFEGITYQIPNQDKWVIKVFKRSDFLKIPNEKPKIIEIEDKSPYLNIGQTIAKIEVPAGKEYSYVYYILKKQNGKPYSVDFEDSIFYTENSMKLYLESLKKLSEYPQSSFNKLIKDIKTITELGYEIDCSNPNNILVDDELKSINFVDINDRLKLKNNQYGEVLYSLLGGNFAVTLAFEENQDNEMLNELRNKILDKYYIAMRNNNVKFEKGMFFDKLTEYKIIKEIPKDLI